MKGHRNPQCTSDQWRRRRSGKRGSRLGAGLDLGADTRRTGQVSVWTAYDVGRRLVRHDLRAAVHDFGARRR